MRALCEHTMNTTNFVCKEGKFPLLAGVPAWLPVEVARAYPTLFKIKRYDPDEIEDTGEVEATVEDFEVVCDSDEEKVEAIEYEATEAVAPDKEKELDLDLEVEKLNKIDDPEKWAESVSEVAEKIDSEKGPILAGLENVTESDAFDEAIDGEGIKGIIDGYITADLIKTAESENEMLSKIDSFKTRKKLDVFAEGLGVKLDGRTKLKDMKSTLKEKLELI